MAAVTVSDAARRLGIDESRVRQMLRAGELAGQRIGATWLVDAAAVSRRQHQAVPAGRPLSPSRAWALLDLIDGGSAPWLTAQSRSQLRARLRGLQGATPQRLHAVLRARSDRHSYRAHPAAVRRLLGDSRIVVAGPTEAARAGLDLVATDARPEVYVRPDDELEVVRELALRLAPESPDVLIRVPRQVWPFAGSTAGPATLAADLLESDEPRAVTAGAAWLDDHLVRAMDPRPT